MFTRCVISEKKIGSPFDFVNLIRLILYFFRELVVKVFSYVSILRVINIKLQYFYF